MSGPFPSHVCRHPNPTDHTAGDRWACPTCGTCFRLTRPKRTRWWRRWSAPDGCWRHTTRMPKEWRQ